MLFYTLVYLEASFIFLFYVSVREWLVGGGFSILCVESADGESVGERRRGRQAPHQEAASRENNLNEVPK